MKKENQLMTEWHRLQEEIRTETGTIDDSYENPLERGMRYSNMDRLRAEIEQERIQIAEKKAAYYERLSEKERDDNII